jgi:hypothetical protein
MRGAHSVDEWHPTRKARPLHATAVACCHVHTCTISLWPLIKAHPSCGCLSGAPRMQESSQCRRPVSARHAHDTSSEARFAHVVSQLNVAKKEKDIARRHADTADERLAELRSRLTQEASQRDAAERRLQALEASVASTVSEAAQVGLLPGPRHASTHARHSCRTPGAQALVLSHLISACVFQR